MYKIDRRAVNYKLETVLIRDNGEESFFVLSDNHIRRIAKIDAMDEDTRQMRLQTLYLYLMSIGEKEHKDAGEEYQAELAM